MTSVSESAYRFAYSLDEIPAVLLSYLDDKVETDVELSVQCGDGWINFSAHKLILALWSPVFADKFFDSDSKIDNVIRITGVTPSAFNVMLKFMYGHYKLRRQVKDVPFLLKVYKAAAQFGVEALKSMCCEMFVSTIPNKGNVFQLLDAGKLIGSESLQQRCYKVLQTQTAEVLAAQELCNVSLSMIMTILDMPRVSFCSEYELVMWVFAWAKNEFLKESNERSLNTIMESVLPSLKLVSLKPEEFGSVFLNFTDVMSEQDGFKIFMNIVNPGTWPLPDWYCITEKSRSYQEVYEGDSSKSYSSLQFVD